MQTQGMRTTANGNGSAVVGPGLTVGGLRPGQEYDVDFSPPEDHPADASAIFIKVPASSRLSSGEVYVYLVPVGF